MDWIWGIIVSAAAVLGLLGARKWWRAKGKAKVDES